MPKSSRKRLVLSELAQGKNKHKCNSSVSHIHKQQLRTYRILWCQNWGPVEMQILSPPPPLSWNVSLLVVLILQSKILFMVKSTFVSCDVDAFSRCCLPALLWLPGSISACCLQELLTFNTVLHVHNSLAATSWCHFSCNTFWTLHGGQLVSEEAATQCTCHQKCTCTPPVISRYVKAGVKHASVHIHNAVLPSDRHREGSTALLICFACQGAH